MTRGFFVPKNRGGNEMKKAALFLAILMVAMAFAGCGAEAESSKVAEIKEAGQLILGTSADYPPYEFHKMIEGKDAIVGFDIMIAEKIAEDLGVELVIKDMAFDGLIAALQGGKIDLIIAGMSATPEREEAVDFSQQYYFEKQTLLIKEEKLDTYTSIASLDGIKIGVQTSSIQEGLAQEILVTSSLTSLPDIAALVLELKTGKVEGVILVKPVANGYIAQNPELMLSTIDFGEGDGASCAVAEGSDLVEPVNKILTEIIESGELEQFVFEANMMLE
jgi:polar amino acid transport system substrate-binding protein